MNLGTRPVETCPELRYRGNMLNLGTVTSTYEFRVNSYHSFSVATRTSEKCKSCTSDTRRQSRPRTFLQGSSPTNGAPIFFEDLSFPQ